MMLNHPPSPFTRAQEVLGEPDPNQGRFLAPGSYDGPGPEAMETEAETLLLALWPQIRTRFPDARRENALPIVWSIVSMGGTIDDPDEALHLFDLLARFGGEVSALEIREAARILGDQADLFLDPWSRGHHQRLTGTYDFPVALWEHRTFLRLTEEGAERVRRMSGLPEPVDTGTHPARWNAPVRERTRKAGRHR